LLALGWFQASVPFPVPPKAGDLMDELATAYGQKWFQAPKDVGNLGPENATERVRKNCFNGDTGNPMSLILMKSESCFSVSIFTRKPLNTGNEAKITSAPPGASAKVCSRFWLREIRFPHALEGWVRLGGSTAGWFHTSRHGFKMVPPKHQEYSLAGLEQPKR